jgi:hypothetical protein
VESILLPSYQVTVTDAAVTDAADQAQRHHHSPTSVQYNLHRPEEQQSKTKRRKQPTMAAAAALQEVKRKKIRTQTLI